MTAEREFDSTTLRVFGGIMIVLALLVFAGSFLGYYTISRNALYDCLDGPYPRGVDGSRESPVTDSHAVFIPVGLSCSFYIADGSTLEVLTPNWVSTAASAVGIVGIIGGIGFLGLAAKRDDP